MTTCSISLAGLFLQERARLFLPEDGCFFGLIIEVFFSLHPRLMKRDSLLSLSMLDCSCTLYFLSTCDGRTSTTATAWISALWKTIMTRVRYSCRVLPATLWFVQWGLDCVMGENCSRMASIHSEGDFLGAISGIQTPAVLGRVALPPLNLRAFQGWNYVHSGPCPKSVSERERIIIGFDIYNPCVDHFLRTTHRSHDALSVCLHTESSTEYSVYQLFYPAAGSE